MDKEQAAKDREDFDRLNAAFFDAAGDRASGLNLEEIGMSGHGLANTLWKVAAYLRNRNDKLVEEK